MSHGKSAFNALNGTIKRIISKACLQRPLHNQIINMAKMYDFCKEKRHNFFMVTKNAKNKLCCEISHRLQQAKTIPGMKSIYYFEPTCSLSIRGKRISSNTNFFIYASFDKTDTVTLTTSYVACIHDLNWYIGLISEIHTDEGDATIKFIHPHGP